MANPCWILFSTSAWPTIKFWSSIQNSIRAFVLVYKQVNFCSRWGKAIGEVKPTFHHHVDLPLCTISFSSSFLFLTEEVGNILSNILSNAINPLFLDVNYHYKMAVKEFMLHQTGRSQDLAYNKRWLLSKVNCNWVGLW